MKERIFWNKQEAEEYLKEHCPATGILLEGHNDAQPYWTVICF